MDGNNTDRDSLITAEENRVMFDQIAKNYDAANQAITAGMCVRWRRKAVRILKPYRGGRYLDVGTGTGDLVFEMLEQSANILVDGVDASEPMLELARRKAEVRDVGDAVSFFKADALELPMESDTYDGIISGFCFRNIEHRQVALQEMLRVLKPNGMLVILEATYPERALVRFGYRLYRPFVPFVGQISGRRGAYKYLMDSIENFPRTDMVLDMFSASGFSGIRCEPLACGCVTVFYGKK